MNTAQAGKFSVFQAGNLAEDLGLRAVFQLGLKADHVEQRAQRIVLAQLHNGIGFHVRIMRIGQAHRLHRSPTQSLATALGHHFNRQAAIKIRRVFPFLEFGFRAINQRVNEGIILVFIHRAVEIGGLVGLRLTLVIA